MEVKEKTGFVRMFLALALSFLGSAAAQNPVQKTETRPTEQAASSPASEQHSSSLGKPNAEDDFHRRVAARWQAARKGLIEVYVTPDGTNIEAYRVRVVVTRAPSGSDGMTAPSPSGTASWRTLLKLDDELRVRLTSESAAGLTVEPMMGGSSSLIQRLDPGGHAEWTWSVRKKAQDVDRLLLQADVVYRQDFSPAGKPVVIYPSAETKISIPESPTHSIANPLSLPGSKELHESE
jgi:hypothetical protein